MSLLGALRLCLGWPPLGLCQGLTPLNSLFCRRSGDRDTSLPCCCLCIGRDRDCGCHGQMVMLWHGHGTAGTAMAQLVWPWHSMELLEWPAGM